MRQARKKRGAKIVTHRCPFVSLYLVTVSLRHDTWRDPTVCRFTARSFLQMYTFSSPHTSENEIIAMTHVDKEVLKWWGNPIKITSKRQACMVLYLG